MRCYLYIILGVVIVLLLTIHPAAPNVADITEIACDCTDTDVGCISDCLDTREAEPEFINLPHQPMD